MDIYNYIAFFIFSFVASVTPGPANISIFSQSSKNNWVKTIPFALGITIGFTIVLYTSAYIYLSGTKADDRVMLFLKIIGSLYLLWISYQIIRSSTDLSAKENSPSLSFSSGLFIHPLSYKAWLFAILSYSSFVAGEYKQHIFIYAVIFLISSIISLIPWMILGHIAGHYLSSRKVDLINKISGWILIFLVIYVWVT
ncbi:LysE family translocator [Lonsdalea quercina]|uniref:LysE family translocator n=1 Tax=Lonsdalea quercina TaxID=71657 RepID=UPI0039770C6E